MIKAGKWILGGAVLVIGLVVFIDYFVWFLIAALIATALVLLMMQGGKDKQGDWFEGNEPSWEDKYEKVRKGRD